MTVEILAAAAVVLALVAIGGMALIYVRGRQAPEPSSPPEPAFEQMGAQIAQLVGAVGAYRNDMNSKLSTIEGTVADQRSTLTEQVRTMGAQIGTITGLFTNDRARGNWGEISMIRAFEVGGLVEGRDYSYHPAAGGSVPDAIVHLPGGCDVVIDAKFPTARYIEAMECEDPEQQQSLLATQGQELRRVGKGLINKGYAELATGGYVVMYLPSQAVYEAALGATPEVVDELLSDRVMVAGPTAFFALLMNIGSLVKEHRGIEQAGEILEAAMELQGRIGAFLSHVSTTGQHLERTVKAFNGAVGSWTSRVEPQLNRIQDLSGHEIDAEVVPIDESIRQLDGSRSMLRVADR